MNGWTMYVCQTNQIKSTMNKKCRYFFTSVKHRFGKMAKLAWFRVVSRWIMITGIETMIRYFFVFEKRCFGAWIYTVEIRTEITETSENVTLSWLRSAKTLAKSKSIPLLLMVAVRIDFLPLCLYFFRLYNVQY